ncbi:hypothetical protein MNBD_PLANCTO02-1314, partial [hydrothermal vent metagenome]
MLALLRDASMAPKIYSWAPVLLFFAIRQTPKGLAVLVEQPSLERFL